uniref:Secreted protein n=1 Tax=Ascaris lumbricoides TaxID=6252 RepID=A0A0M3IF57_ASCLU
MCPSMFSFANFLSLRKFHMRFCDCFSAIAYILSRIYASGDYENSSLVVLSENLEIYRRFCVFSRSTEFMI